MEPYDPKKIEAKWQKKWEESKIFEVTETSKNPKWYSLYEFNYPSGVGLHVGHVRTNTAMDIISRKRRMQSFNVLYPVGWDSFGLPTENYAIKTGIHPQIVTKQSTDNFRRQMKSLGYSMDWSREIDTSDPKYYKWTQWIFLQMFKSGLAYKAKSNINWCPIDKIGLANEEVVGGNCERCGSPVEKREKEQWMLAITKYADRLNKDLDTVDYSERIKIQQREWIGRSTGAEIIFPLRSQNDAEQTQNIAEIKVFTIRADTIFGATYLVLAPEHEIIINLKNKIGNTKEVEGYITATKKKNEIERTGAKEKTGVRLEGVMAINPATKKEIPVFIADYILPHYGTGAIMAVPAHDERDMEFSKKFDLPASNAPLRSFDEVLKIVGGKKVVKYKLRDWVFSRQRYWGEPIPLVFCEKDGWVAVPESDLPVVLPELDDFKPTDNGDSPLAKAVDWINTICPTCDGPAKRETDVMPNWAGSSWYYLAYAMYPTLLGSLTSKWDKRALDYWTPVDWYNGGMEHTTLHLLYSRFWHKFLFDEGFVPTSEPYKKRTSHGLILAHGGLKMSKSKGDVVNPDDIIERFGADSLRLYEMFMGPFEQAIAWDENGLVGTRRFIEKIWRLQEKLSEGDAMRSLVHKTVKKVSDDIENMAFNTAVSAMMILVNDFDKIPPTKSEYKIVLQLLAPFAPHVTEELWYEIGHENSIHIESWPTAVIFKSNTATITVQINGKFKTTISLAKTATEDEALALAMENSTVRAKIGEQKPTRIVYVPGRILNIVL